MKVLNNGADAKTKDKSIKTKVEES
jgi:hypothetical protein